MLAQPYAHAIKPETRLTQYGHTAWRVRDGYFSGAPNAISQTSDGYMWVGTGAGLLRFDGVRFETFHPLQNKDLSSNYIVSLAAAKDGRLFVGTSLGLDLITSGSVRSFSSGKGRVNQIILDSRGNAWYARSRSRDSTGPLCTVLASGVRCFGVNEGLTIPVASALMQDSEGAFWIGGSTAVVRWVDGRARTYSSPRFSSGEHLSGFAALVDSGKSSIYAGLAHPGPGLGIEQIVDERFKPVKVPDFDGSRIEANTFLRDREGALWIGTSNEGLYRLHKGRVEHYRSADGLSGDAVNQIFEDREGVIWIVTSHGIDNFRDLGVLTLSTAEGLTSDGINGLAVAKDGSVWLGYENGLNIVRSGQVTKLGQAQGLPGKQVTSLLEDERGQWWIGVDQGIFLYSAGHFTEITDNGEHVGPIIALASDHDGGMWAVANGKRPALLHLQKGQVTSRAGPPGDPRAGAIYSNDSGGTWIGYVDGSVGYQKPGLRKRIELGITEQISIRRILGFGPNGPLILTQEGLYGIRNDHPQVLNKANGLPDAHMRSGVFDLKGDLWLMCDVGILHLSRSEIERWWVSPSTSVHYKLLTASDGVLLSQDPFDPSTGVTPDNKVWFATEQNGVEIIDASAEHLQRLLPPVRIEDFHCDHKLYALVGAIQLPPKPRNIMIDYAALSFAAPADLQFRYRLDGHDSTWMDAGARRTAYFEDLKPGHYRFHVVASNQQGLWNPEEAVLDFSVAPAWYQTRWFLCVWVATASLVIWLAYRLRIRAVAHAMNSRFDERLAERTRMARELHDTFLQTVQSSKMVADDALADGSDELRMSRALVKLSEWLGQAVIEGRAALNALRASTLERNHLAEAFREALDELPHIGIIETRIHLSGTPQELHPIVRAELCDVGLEAIRNAIYHSRAKHLRVELIYSRTLTLKVVDDGVGIPAEYIERGKLDHFGITGMRERVERIRGHIKITSSPNAGTQVCVSVPSASAYLRLAKGKDRRRFFSPRSRTRE
ncbi:signal transduction histidine kinase [Granulicella aggregans]|uniref:Signal transduction histidine kinase n=1 Tax=Granulicella aggregans TaxID=474949 RepID=A0A7W7ZJL0_9BACT|nr:sensor histidine kinase [Granulicella aggregans]MBB5061116.1 signal transduction histidine kinase [Granulicella aggregans]